MWRTETIHYAPTRSRSSRSAERLGERARRRRRWERHMIDRERTARGILELEAAVAQARIDQIMATNPHFKESGTAALRFMLLPRHW